MAAILSSPQSHWGRVTHICVSKLTTIGSDNGLSPGRHQAIIWTNDGILLIRTLGTNFSEILSKIHSFSFKKMHLKMSSAKWRLFSLGLNELMVLPYNKNDFMDHIISCLEGHWSIHTKGVILINSLIPGKCGCNLKLVISKLIWKLQNLSCAFHVNLPSGECHKTSLKISRTLVQVMSWCYQATIHYLNQCWASLCHHMLSPGNNELISTNDITKIS